MIKSLEITNFQSHKNTRLDFCPRVNVIIGASDCGKSAIIRSLRWLLLNRPTGTAFRSHWCGKGSKTEVRITPAHDPVLVRRRTVSSNEYAYGEVETVLEAVRTDVPSEISNIHNMDELINIQQQGDRPFLLDESPPEVARILNTIVGLDTIDTAHTRIAGKIRENQEAVRTTTAVKAGLAERIKGYEGLDQIEANIRIVDALASRLEAGQKALVALEAVVVSMGKLHAIVGELEAVAGVEKMAEKCAKGVESITKLTDKCDSIIQVITNLAVAKTYAAALKDIPEQEAKIIQISSLQSLYNGAEQQALALGNLGRTLSYAQADSSQYAVLKIDDTLSTIVDLEELRSDTKELETRDLALVGIGRSMAPIKTWLEGYTAEYNELESKLGTMVCPSCGTSKGEVRI